MKHIIGIFAALAFLGCDHAPLKTGQVVEAGAPPKAATPDPISPVPTAPTVPDTSNTTNTATTPASGTATESQTATGTLTETNTVTSTQTATVSSTVSETSTAVTTQTATQTDTSVKSGCQVTGQVDLSIDGPKASKKIMPLTSAASDSGSAIAFFDETSEDVAVNLYDRSGKFLSQSRLSYRSTPSGSYSINPSYVKMAGGKDDYVVAVTDVAPSEDNGWLSDYSIYHVTATAATIAAQPTKIQSLALAFDGNGEFYSVEMSVLGKGVTSCNEPVDDLSISVRPLLSGLLPGQFQSMSGGMRLVDAGVINDQLAILTTGEFTDCGTDHSQAWISIQSIIKSDTAVSGGPIITNPLLGLSAFMPRKDTAFGLLYSSDKAGMVWVDDTYNSGGGYNRSFRIDMWQDGSASQQLPTSFAQPFYDVDRPAVMGWNDNIVQATVGWDTDPFQVLLYVSNGSGDGASSAYKLYEHDVGQYIQSFAGRDRHFIILDGTDMVRGSYGARATFVTCN